MPKKRKYSIGDEIDHVLNNLKTMMVDSEEYCKAVQQLDVLCKARSYKTDRSISMDVLLTVGANILGIILILEWENVHVISSKALGMLIKAKI